MVDETSTATESAAPANLLSTEDTATAAPTVDTGVAGENGGNWYDSLADDYKSNQHITKYTSLDELAKGHLELNSKIGTMRDEGREEGKAEYFNELGGKPESADGYTFELPEGTPNELGETFDKFKEYAFENDVPQATFEKMVAFQLEQEAELSAYANERFKEAQDALKANWGDDFNANINAATNALKQFGGTEEEVAHLQDIFGRDPVAISMLHRVSQAIQEDSVTQGADPVRNPTNDINSLKKELADLNSVVFKKANTPEKKTALDRRLEIMKQINTLGGK